MKSNNSQTLWTNLTETQAEAVNGGLVLGNIADFSKLTDQSNAAAILASGNAIGAFNSAGVTSTQINVA
jgi:phosphodiesterase/alkaline phosphatase D-like protein